MREIRGEGKESYLPSLFPLPTKSLNTMIMLLFWYKGNENQEIYDLRQNTKEIRYSWRKSKRNSQNKNKF